MVAVPNVAIIHGDTEAIIGPSGATKAESTDVQALPRPPLQTPHHHRG